MAPAQNAQRARAVYNYRSLRGTVDMVFLVVAEKKKKCVDSSTRGARSQHCHIRVTRRVRSDLST